MHDLGYGGTLQFVQSLPHMTKLLPLQRRHDVIDNLRLPTRHARADQPRQLLEFVVHVFGQGRGQRRNRVLRVVVGHFSSLMFGLGLPVR